MAWFFCIYEVNECASTLYEEQRDGLRLRLIDGVIVWQASLHFQEPTVTPGIMAVGAVPVSQDAD